MHFNVPLKTNKRSDNSAEELVHGDLGLIEKLLPGGSELHQQWHFWRRSHLSDSRTSPVWWSWRTAGSKPGLQMLLTLASSPGNSVHSSLNNTKTCISNKSTYLETTISHGFFKLWCHYISILFKLNRDQEKTFFTVILMMNKIVSCIA